jgi:thiamine pyrophosphokinase
MNPPPAAPSLVSNRRSVVVFVGGDPVAPDVIDRLPEGAYVIAADSGVERAQALELPIDLAIGDFDSVAPAALAAAERAGARVERHPVDKDATDLELALAAAAAFDPVEIVVVGGGGGRLDHLLGGVLALTADAYERIRVRAETGRARVFVVRDHLELTGVVGEILTLLPVGGPARGITTAGLRYPLSDETLEPASTRGISNVLVAEHATVTVTDGLLLAVLPGAPAPTDTAIDPGGRP